MAQAPEAEIDGLFNRINAQLNLARQEPRTEDKMVPLTAAVQVLANVFRDFLNGRFEPWWYGASD